MQDIIVQTLNIRQIKVLDNTEIVKALTKEEIIIRQLDPNRHWLEATDGRVFDFDEAFWCTQVDFVMIVCYSILNFDVLFTNTV